MSFGKSGGGNDLRQLVKPASPAKASKSGSLDAGFIALTLGVVAISAGGAFAAPSIMSWAGSFSSAPVRPIPTVIAGLDRNAVKAALAKEAFPDKQGRAFMASIAGKFPEDHDALLSKLADSAMKGADRDGLVLAMNEWSFGFTTGHLDAIGRTGANGFNKGLDIAQEALGHIETAANGCDLKALESMAMNPEKLLAATTYGGDLYKFNMKSNQVLIDLAVAGRDAPAVDTTLQPEDEQAVQSLAFSLMSDPQITSLMKMSMRGNVSESEIASKVNVCALGRTVVVKLKSLPDGTKARIWALGASELRKAMASGSFRQFNPAQLSMR
jgi:hypothetical protein